MAAPSHRPDRISFEVEQLRAIDSGVTEIRGRWYGVRGRRFVRPALILHGSDGPERRILAELSDKPWAALDGEPWQVTFALDGALGPFVTLELSVAPDIAVTLRPTSGAQSARRVDVPRSVVERPVMARPISPADAPTAGPAPTPALAAGSAPPAPSAPSAPTAALAPSARPARPTAGRAPETERLTARLTSAEAAMGRERARREEAELALEQERAAARERSAELGRAQAELELARAAERESRATADLLDASRRDHHAADARYEALADEHERALRVTERLRAQLSEREHDLTAVPRAAALPHHDHAPPPVPHTDRPLNPALHSRSWALRLLAVLILAAVVIAVYLILHSTVLH